ncbi:uncharacterized protein LOC109713928 [Ananas comosus]|uniref:Uncharacterized protein LOC109713928 n=1 Tax=Ananas comosus TaxID=4615 RepID=A0A6P5FKZ9_ANACO|nr:uncharacterized protein LOC109713928 [Ananas comosus]
MKKRAAASTASRAKSRAKPFLSPLPTPSTPTPNRSSKPYAPSSFDLTFLASASSNKKVTSSKTLTPGSLPSTPPKTLASIADLRSLAASRLDSVKRELDLCHSAITKEFDASHNRISKRCKIQTQACLQLTEEVDKEYKKLSDRIKENSELIKASYVEFMAEAQSTASRVCKASISELSQSMEKAIDSLRTRYNIPATPV